MHNVSDPCLFRLHADSFAHSPQQANAMALAKVVRAHGRVCRGLATPLDSWSAEFCLFPKEFLSRENTHSEPAVHKAPVLQPYSNLVSCFRAFSNKEVDHIWRTNVFSCCSIERKLSFQVRYICWWEKRKWCEGILDSFHLNGERFLLPWKLLEALPYLLITVGIS